MSVAVRRYGSEDILSVPSAVDFSTHNGSAKSPLDFMAKMVSAAFS